MIEKVVRFLVERAGKEYSPKFRALATALGATLFLIVWPLVVGWGGLAWQGEIFSVPASKVLSTALFILGIPCVAWAVAWQLWKGKGTPVPLVPTRNFLQSGPYKYCRNPMMLGFFFYLSGWAVRFNQLGAYAAAALLVLLLAAEIKFIEERELELRFGDAYREYKKIVPPFIPKFK